MKKVNSTELVDWWLKKYFNTTLDSVEQDHPEWMENPRAHSVDFYNTYRVTQEQCDEWEKWAKKYVKKVTKCSKEMLKQSWPWIYLDCSPSIIKKKEK